MYIYIDISRWIHNTPRIEVYIHIRVYIYILVSVYHSVEWLKDLNIMLADMTVNSLCAINTENHIRLLNFMRAYSSSSCIHI